MRENETETREESPDAASISPGPRIRRIRRSLDMTLQDMAEKTGLSEGFLSQAERRKANLSFSSLMRIAGALNVPMSALLAEESGEPEPRKPLRQVLVDHPSGLYRDRFVTPPDAKTLQVIEAVLEPGEGSRVAPYAHSGEEECLLVLEGHLELQSGQVVHQLHAGESALIDPGTPHSYRNPGRAAARWLWISALPGHEH
ncbi:cupin domain-containing protein [Arthrobacter crystallopoietes]|uniref:Helix-turn-helix domain-containing protein n=1 Tax=Crystallibacter crystallopoietes TaxID=37928 RepID=A0A1H1HXQ4_9MICC|nr:cupin domain-containing protein [Arthrobacter crystallopoietes]AUI53666.1 XRE family transcriptional regulator [Arthrobacter crystallopoietes]AUI53846.1 XRE family transcriptional regulator [Arthrobacter crystallopoietes]SDR30222.1 Helix-turn-helix domain-containing protein [Arthrobacter crystallopoietes]